MKHFTYATAGIVLIVLVSHVYFSASAQKNVHPKWEYATITGTYLPYAAENPTVIVAVANICFLGSGGCQNEEVRADVIYTKFFQEARLESSQKSRQLAARRAEENAMAKAISKLGGEGWEMTSSPAIEFDNYVANLQGTFTIEEGNKERKPDIYFKRQKQ